MWLLFVFALGCASKPAPLPALPPFEIEDTVLPPASAPSDPQEDAQEGTEGLRVAPPDALTFSATTRSTEELRGEFLIGNAAARAIEWRATCDADWLVLKKTGGTVQKRERVRLIVAIESGNLARLAPGVHRASVRFDNLTNRVGSTTREVVLILAGDKGLAVSRADGGFELTNESANPIEWRARPMAPWITLEPRTGELAAGAGLSVSVRVDSERRPASDAPTRTGVAFVNTTDGVGTRMVPLELPASGARLDSIARGADASRVSSISQFEITWTFDQEVEAGRFANGDWWVVGPVLVVDVNPPSSASGRRTMNGSMVNPSPKGGMQQGYDSAMYGKYGDRSSYAADLNVALGISTRRPMFLAPGSSLVSTVSIPKSNARPQVGTAAVLTVLDRAAPAGSFRPPYAGSDKRIRYNTSDLDRSKLTSLRRVPSTPSMAEVERMFERPWIDHVPMWIGRYIHPMRNMPDYGREITDHVSTGALMLLIDFSPAEKETLLVRYVQLGIDLFGLLEEGQTWPPAAGHLNGRKWPILFAGLMLGDERMQSIGKNYGPSVFSEDGQTFYVDAARPELGYTEAHIGLAEWGASHSTHPDLDDPRWFDNEAFPRGATQVELRTQNVKYRLCCSANTFWGEVLAARILGAKDLWAHDALFDYQDRYAKENRQRRVTGHQNSWRPFYFDMWRAYRDQY